MVNPTDSSPFLYPTLDNTSTQFSKPLVAPFPVIPFLHILKFVCLLPATISKINSLKPQAIKVIFSSLFQANITLCSLTTLECKFSGRLLSVVHPQALLNNSHHTLLQKHFHKHTDITQGTYLAIPHTTAELNTTRDSSEIIYKCTPHQGLPLGASHPPQALLVIFPTKYGMPSTSTTIFSLHTSPPGHTHRQPPFPFALPQQISTRVKRPNYPECFLFPTACCFFALHQGGLCDTADLSVPILPHHAYSNSIFVY